MIFYFTYNDQPSGVYYSQVCDVVNFMNARLNADMRLFALVSARSWRDSRKTIRAKCPNAIVWPMVPKAKNWRWNSMLLALMCIMKRPTGIMARGVFAGVLALRARDKRFCKQVCFDARGAYAAEFQEYRVIDDDHLIAQMPDLEKQVIQASDFRLAVSNALISHWQKSYGYNLKEHVVIPCTLSSNEENGGEPVDFSYEANEVVLAYAGSTAGWQSFGLLEKLLVPILNDQEQVCVLFLSKEDKNNQRLKERFGKRVQVLWLAPEQVVPTLKKCDYGILIREDTVTNQVASPTKYAEYLQAGLKVIISDKIGDMSEEVRDKGLGHVWHHGSGQQLSFTKVTAAEKERITEHATSQYTKGRYEEAYKQILESLK